MAQFSQFTLKIKNDTGESIERTIPLLFGMDALKKIFAEKEISEFGSTDFSAIDIMNVIYFGHVNYCEVKRIKKMATADQIYDYIEPICLNVKTHEAEFAQILDLFTVFGKALPTVAPEEIKESAEKKILTGI